MILLLLLRPTALPAQTPEEVTGALTRSMAQGQALQRQIEAEMAALEQLRAERRQAQLLLEWTRHQSRRTQAGLVQARADRDAVVQRRLAARQLRLELEPWLDEALARLHAVVAADLPFLAQERQLRLDGLDRWLADPAAPVSERLRRLLEALRVEAGYGHDLELREEPIALGGEELRGEVLRLGRVALLFRSLDGTRLARRLPGRDWEALAADWEPALRAAREVAQRQRTPQLLVLPIGEATP